MTYSDHQFMNDNRWAVESYSQNSPPRTMRMMDRERLRDIIKKYIDPGAQPDLWCEPCLKTFIINSYILYDEYIKQRVSTAQP